jgi:tetratricopeptide (TPR) repeat protein
VAALRLLPVQDVIVPVGGWGRFVGVRLERHNWDGLVELDLDPKVGARPGIAPIPAGADLGIVFLSFAENTPAMACVLKFVAVAGDLHAEQELHLTVAAPRTQNTKEDNDTVRLHPDDPVAYLNRAHTLDLLQDYNASIKDYDKAIELAPLCSLAYEYRAIAYLHKGDNDQAVKDFDQAIKLNPKGPLAYILRSEANLNRGVYDKVIEDCTYVLSIDSTRMMAYRHRGLAHYNRQEYAEAIKDYDKAIELAQKNPQLTILVPLASLHKLRADAVAKLEPAAPGPALRLLPIRDVTVPAGSRFGGRFIAVRLERQKCEGPVVLALDPRPAWLLSFWGLVHAGANVGVAWVKVGPQTPLGDAVLAVVAQCGNLRSEQQVFHLKVVSRPLTDQLTEDIKEVDRYKDDPAAYLNLAFTRVELQKDYDKAIKDCDKAIELAPKCAEAYNARGMAYWGMGPKNDDKAITDWTRAIELNPNFDGPYLNRSAAFVRHGTFDKAIEDCTQAINIAPMSAEAYRYRANACEKKGDQVKAKADRDKAKELEEQMKR